jgi:hypothetical protein
MKEFHQADVLNKVRALWPKVDKVKADKVKGGWDLELSNMYEAPGLRLQDLIELVDFFGTKNIESAGNFSHGGCETCDFGSSYGFTLQVRD